jgi:hypothetical protein
MTFIQNNPLSRRKSSPCNANGDDKTISEVREEPGSSNAGKYPDVNKFCGPAGGAAKGTYPVEKDGKLDMGRISAAKSYADNAPDPAGIRACADKYEAQLKGKGEAVSRRSSSPLNIDPEMEDPKNAEEEEAARSKAELDRIKAAHDAKKAEEAKKRALGTSRRSSSPVNYSGLPGVNEDMALADIEAGRGKSNWEAHHGYKKGVPPSRHGSMKGDQSATHTDYSDFKDTDPGYHGHDGESHGDQSATHTDYMGNMGRHKIDPRTKR